MAINAEMITDRLISRPRMTDNVAPEYKKVTALIKSNLNSYKISKTVFFQTNQARQESQLTRRLHREAPEKIAARPHVDRIYFEMDRAW